MRVLKVPKCKRVTQLLFAPGGERIAVVTSKAEGHVGSVVWVDLATDEPCHTIPLDSTRCIFSPSLDKLAVSYSPYSRPGGASEVRWADLRSGKDDILWNDISGLPHRHIFSLAFSPDGKHLAIGCSGQKSFSHAWEHAIHIAPIKDGPAAILPVEASAGELQFSPDGRWLVVTGGPGGDPRIRFRDAAAGAWSGEYTPKATRTRRIVFAPDRAEFVALAAKKAILFEAGRPEPQAVLEGHGAAAADAAYMRDGRGIITVGGDSTARIWDARTGANRGAFAWPVGKLSAVAIAPDGLTAAAAGEKGQIVMWDLDD